MSFRYARHNLAILDIIFFATPRFDGLVIGEIEYALDAWTPVFGATCEDADVRLNPRFTWAVRVAAEDRDIALVVPMRESPDGVTRRLAREKRKTVGIGQTTLMPATLSKWRDMRQHHDPPTRCYRGRKHMCKVPGGFVAKPLETAAKLLLRQVLQLADEPKVVEQEPRSFEVSEACVPPAIVTDKTERCAERDWFSAA